jgi:hypothetical protein
MKRLSLKIPKSGEGEKLAFQTTEELGWWPQCGTPNQLVHFRKELFQGDGKLFQPSATAEGRKKGNNPGWRLECAAWTKAAERSQMPAVRSGISFHTLLSHSPKGKRWKRQPRQQDY